MESVRQVTESSEEQAATTIHIGKNIETISRVSRENAAGNQAIASSVQEMNALIGHLQTLHSPTPHGAVVPDRSQRMEA